MKTNIKSGIIQEKLQIPKIIGKLNNNPPHALLELVKTIEKNIRNKKEKLINLFENLFVFSNSKARLKGQIIKSQAAV
tara:strand:+ start:2168 stop:2401 length:234 start_codon:yes stop_codon:yes gene_type:complete